MVHTWKVWAIRKCIAFTFVGKYHSMASSVKSPARVGGNFIFVPSCVYGGRIARCVKGMATSKSDDWVSFAVRDRPSYHVQWVPVFLS